MQIFACVCGSEFKTREEIRKHVKTCSKSSAESICSVCTETSRVLLPYGTRMVCPLCAVSFEKPTFAFGTPMINHMGKKYDNIFRNKVGVLLKRLKINKLSELGIDVVLITFSQGFNFFDHSYSPRGELIFIFAKTDQLRDKEDKIFQYVINHEVFHGYLWSMKIGVTHLLKGPFTFIEQAAGSFAEDIQLMKIAVNKEVKPLIKDETRRDYVYYKNLPAPSNTQWKMLPEGLKFTSMISVTLAYATELWFKEVLKDSHSKKQVKKNIRLIRPHYSLHGNDNLKNVIEELYRGNIARTKKEKKTMFERVLACFDEWVNNKGFNLY